MLTLHKYRHRNHMQNEEENPAKHMQCFFHGKSLYRIKKKGAQEKEKRSTAGNQKKSFIFFRKLAFSVKEHKQRFFYFVDAKQTGRDSEKKKPRIWKNASENESMFGKSFKV